MQDVDVSVVSVAIESIESSLGGSVSGLIVSVALALAIVLVGRGIDDEDAS